MHRGDRIAGRFEIVGEAARGGMGTVFRARDRRDQRDVALKILRGDTADDAARFDREAAILASIEDPGIVRHVAHGGGPGAVRYLAMAWIEGETLARRLSGGPLALRVAVGFGRESSRALAVLHGAGIVHRDVKPDNLMLVDGDRVVLVDLGIARPAVVADALTRSGTLVGTAGYMAPEQARGERTIDGRTDLFALGCVLYECITGEAAFHGDTALARRAKVLLHDPPRIATLLTDIPPALDALVAALLARDPAARPSDATAVAAALAAIEPAVPAAPAVPRAARASPTGPTWAVLAHGAVAQTDIAELRGFEGGGVAACSTAGEATRIAVALARAPDLVVAVAQGRSPADAIDGCARVIEDAELTAATTGEPAGGAWTTRAAALDPGLGLGLGDDAQLETADDRARIRRLSSS